LLKFFLGERTPNRIYFMFDFAKDIGIYLAIKSGVERGMKHFP